MKLPAEIAEKHKKYGISRVITVRRVAAERQTARGTLRQRRQHDAAVFQRLSCAARANEKTRLRGLSLATTIYIGVTRVGPAR